MAFLTNEKLTIVGAAGMIGSNMAQSALMMGLTSEICLYDVFSPEGVAEEMRQSGFDDVNIVATTDTRGLSPCVLGEKKTMGFETLVTALALQEVYKKSTRKLQESLIKTCGLLGGFKRNDYLSCVPLVASDQRSSGTR